MDPIFAGKKILVVDDDEAVMDYINTLLVSEGFKTVTTDNGKEACRLAQTELPDLIITDAEMPVMNGFEAIKIIRSDPKTRLTPIILVTGLYTIKDRIKGIESGCDDFISKPFDTGELMAKIRSLLKLSYYRQLLDEKEKFEYVLDHMNSGILVLDSDLRLTQINKKAQDLFQIKPPRDPSFDFFSHIFKQFEVRYEGDLRAEVRSKALTFEIARAETKDFSPLILHAQSNWVKDPAGGLSSIVMIVIDVTKQRKMEMVKFSFLDFVSHKLITPLTTISGCFAMLQEGTASKKLIDISAGQVNELQSRIMNILSYCEIMGRDRDFPVDVINLSSYLAQVKGSFAREKNGKKITYEVVCAGENLLLNFEKKYLDLIIKNLVDNAVECNDRDDIAVRIEARQLGEVLEIAVTDNGRGVPPEEYDRIFDKFYQIDKWYTGNFKGVGLGLAIVKQLLTQRGGRIRIDSKVGHGATFTMTLPCGFVSAGDR